MSLSSQGHIEPRNNVLTWNSSLRLTSHRHGGFVLVREGAEWIISSGQFDPSDSDDIPLDNKDSGSALTLVTAQDSPAQNAHNPPQPSSQPPSRRSGPPRSRPFAHAFGATDEEAKIPELDVLMYIRYGFDVEAMASDIHQGILPLPPDIFSFQRVTEILMEKDGISSSRSEAAVRLISTLIDQGWSIPDRYWDVKNGQLRDANQGYFKFFPLKLTSLAPDATVLEGYLVNPTASKYLKPWVLFFESSIGVAQCIRERWGPSLEDVVCKACKNGYRVHLFLVKNRQTLPLITSPLPLFTRREKEEGFTPSQFDFHAYQRIVEALVMHPRFRAAVLRGGILGRICSPYISLDELAEGPSPDAVHYGLRWMAKGGDVVFVEDFISEDEIHLLCGFFYVDNCEFLLFYFTLLRSTLFSLFEWPAGAIQVVLVLPDT